MSLRSRLKHLLTLPKEDLFRLLRYKVRQVSALPFALRQSAAMNVQLSYRPDSYAFFKSHGGFDAIFRRFVRKNWNNAGDSTRLWSIHLNLVQVIEEGVQGDFAELGVWRGNTAAVLAHFAAESGRQVLLFDTFSGFANEDLRGIDAGRNREFSDTSCQLVADVIGPNVKVCEFVSGRFPGSLQSDHYNRRFAAVSLDCDLYEPMRAGLDFFYPRLSVGGLLMIHDYSSGFWPGVRKAVDDFCSVSGERVVLLPDKSGSAFIRRTCADTSLTCE